MMVDGHQQQTKIMEGRRFIITINNKYIWGGGREGEKDEKQKVKDNKSK